MEPSKFTPFLAKSRRKLRKKSCGPKNPRVQKTLRLERGILYRVLSGRSKRWWARAFNALLALLIILNVLAFVMETVPSLDSEWADAFYAFEAVSVSLFTVEYAARVYSVVESKRFSRYGALWGRLRWCLSLAAIVDLLAIIPFFIELILPHKTLPMLTFLRAFRLFRVLKSERYTRAFGSVYRVLWFNSEILAVALFISLLLMLGTSVLLYYLQPDLGDGSDQDFSSIPATFYLSVLMLTGQGEPGGVLPWYTKTVVALTAVFSVAIFAIPASMLTWGFEAEAERLMTKARERRQRLARAKLEGRAETSSSSSSEGEASTDEWDEYERVVLGGDDEGDGDGKKDRLRKRALAFFLRADTDQSGALDAEEFIRFARELQAEAAEAEVEARTRQADLLVQQEMPGSATAVPARGGVGSISRAEWSAVKEKLDHVLSAIKRLENKIDNLTH